MAGSSASIVIFSMLLVPFGFRHIFRLSFWGECVVTAAYIINRTPTPLLDRSDAFWVAIWPSSGSTLSFVSLVVYAYASQLPRSSDKFAARGRRCVFLGYPSISGGGVSMTLEYAPVLYLSGCGVLWGYVSVLDVSIWCRGSFVIRSLLHLAVFDDVPLALPACQTGGVSAIYPLLWSSITYSAAAAATAPLSRQSFATRLASPMFVFTTMFAAHPPY